MHKSSCFQAVRFPGLGRVSRLLSQLALVAFLLCAALPVLAIQVRVRDGQLVRLRLRNILTTDNVQKGDRIDFEVTEEILMNGHVVIAKGALAHGKILDVKGAGKPKAKDAEVVFQFSTVRAVDNQELPLRVQSSKPRKSNPHANEVRERSPIPGYPSRLIGVEKGKDYVAYVEGSFAVNASDTIAVPSATPPAAVHATQPTTPVAAPPIPATTPAMPELGPEPASVEFSSDPQGADILIDGAFVGSTPSTLRVTPGHHAIEIRTPGYRSWTRTMVVDPDSHPSVRARLEKL